MVKTIESNDGSRIYIINNKKYISVTTPLSVLSAPYIELWKARVGENVADQITSGAASHGSRVHDYCEQILLGKDIDVEEKYRKDVQAFKKWSNKSIKEVIAVEEVVWSNKTKVAGRCDLIARVNGLEGICVIDFKTGKAKPQHFLQLAAYRQLSSESLGLNKKDIKHRIVVEVRNGRIRPVYPCKGKIDELAERDWKIYKSVLAIYKWKKNNKYSI